MKSQFPRALFFLLAIWTTGSGGGQNVVAASARYVEPADVAAFRASVGGNVTPVIVELRDQPTVLAKLAQEQLGKSSSIEQLAQRSLQLVARQDDFIASLYLRNIRALLKVRDVPQVDGSIRHVEWRFSYLLSGFVLYVADDDIERLRAQPEVLSLEVPEGESFHLDRAIDYSLGTALDPADRRLAVYGATQEFDPAGSTGHAETPKTTALDGFEGQDINIAVIDSGVDWRHPMFGGIGQASPTPRVSGNPPSPADNTKVIYYYALSSPGKLSDDFGHGTLVASCAAGYRVNGNTPVRPGFGTGRDGTGIGPTLNGATLHGTAPQARIMAYKVCGPSANCLGDIALAIEDAASPFTLVSSGNAGPQQVAKPVADVVNLSLGAASGSRTNINSRMANNAVLNGTILVTSAGNSGGIGTVGSPSVAPMAISVAASLDPGSVASADVLAPAQIPNETGAGKTPAEGAAAGPAEENGAPSDSNTVQPGERIGMKLFPVAGAGPISGGSVSAHYVFVDLRPNDAVAPPTVANRIALVKFTGAFAAAANRLAPLNPAGILLITAVESATAVQVLNGIPTFTMGAVNGDYLIDRIRTGDAGDGDPAVDVPHGTVSELPLRLSEAASAAAYQPAMAGFSSRGPYQQPASPFLVVKPDVTGPGVGIVGAATPDGLPDDTIGLSSTSGYTQANGTSFSGPITAGGVVLIRQYVRNVLGLDTTDLASSSYRSRRFDAAVVTRALLQNSATNLRDGMGVPQGDGAASTASVNEMGSGHINLAAALDGKAIMVSPFTLLADADPATGVQAEFNRPTREPPALDAQGNLEVLIPTASFGTVPVVGVDSDFIRDKKVIVRDVSGGGGAGSYSLSFQDNRNALIDGFAVSFRAADGTTPVTAVTVPSGGTAEFFVRTTARGSKILIPQLEFQWYVTATHSSGRTLRMPFYYRAVQPLIPNITAPAQQAPESVETPATDPACGTDSNGSYAVKFSYTKPAGGPDPLGFRLQEATRFDQLFFDNADESLQTGASGTNATVSNSRWTGTQNWRTQANPDTGSPAYFGQAVAPGSGTAGQNDTLAMLNAVVLPPGGATLTFVTNQNLQATTHAGHVEISTDNFATFSRIASFTGIFSGLRQLDIAGFAGQPIKVRFRLSSGSAIPLSPQPIGWWIENIRILSDDFQTIVDLAPVATGHSFTQLAERTRYYRVAGLFNTADGAVTGPYSNNKCVTVINNRPIPRLRAEPASQRKGLALTLHADTSSDPDGEAIVAYTFNAGHEDAVLIPSGSSASVTYPRGGSYTASVNVEDARGQLGAAAATTAVTVINTAPKAVLTADRTTGTARLHVTFFADKSGDEDAVNTTDKVLRYEFDFGDGAKEPLLAPNTQVSHTFDQPGVYDVYLRVFDEEDLKSDSDAWVQINIPNELPVARLAEPPATQGKNRPVQFDASASSDEGALLYQFDFGDGQKTAFGLDSRVSHAYSRPGQYTVTLTVRDQTGEESSTTRSLTITNVTPTARLTANPTEIQPSKAVTFSGAGSSDPDAGDAIRSYTFDFGDGSAPVTQADAEISHVYELPGDYAATLKVADMDGSVSDPVTVSIKSTSGDDTRLFGGGLPVASLMALALLGLFRGRRAGFAALAVLLLPGALFGATPSRGDISTSTRTLNYTFPAEPRANGSPVVTGNEHYDCDATINPCDTFELTVTLPAGYVAANPNDRLVISPATTSTASDIDSQLRRKSNNEVLAVTRDNPPAQPTIIYSPEDGTQVYLIQVVPGTPHEGGTVSVALVSGDPPPPPPSGSAGRYTTSMSPPALANSAGEPSVGYNPRSKNAMFIAGIETLRITFAENSGEKDVVGAALPASCPAVWHDVSNLSGSATTVDPILFTEQSVGRTFVSNQFFGPNALFNYTDDDGENWAEASASPPHGGVDHQAVGAGPYPAGFPKPPGSPNYAVYYCSQAGADAFCARSDTGGVSFGQGMPITSAVSCGGGGGLHGHPRVAYDGTVALPDKSCNGPQVVYISENAGTTWTARQVTGTSGGATDPQLAWSDTPDPQTSKPVGYFCFTDGDGLPKASVTKDKGATWSTPFNLGLPVGVKNAVFAQGIAGDHDRAACAFIGTTTSGNSGAEDFRGIWFGYVAMTYDQGQTWQVVNVTPGDPVQGEGGICTGGISCGGNRNLLDFNEITRDELGRVIFGYADGCISNTCISTPASNDFEDKGAIARQTGGRGLIAQFDPPAQAVPAAACLSGTRTVTSSKLTWVAPDQGSAAITNYRILRAESVDGPYDLVAISNAIPAFEDLSQDPDVSKYYYRVVAINSVGLGANSNTIELLLGSVAELRCSLPGVTLLTDASGDGLSGDGSDDLLSAHLGQPAGYDGNLVFTLKADNLQNLSSGSGYFISFVAPDGVTRGVRMEVVNPADPTFHTYVAGASSGGIVDGRFVDSQLPAEADSNYNPDTGVILIVVKPSALALSGPGAKLFNFNAGVTQTTDPGGVGAGATVLRDEMPNGLGRQGEYVLAACNFAPPPEENICLAPGHTVLQDASGDALDQQAGHDAQKLSVSQPFTSATGDLLVAFHLKVADLTTLPQSTTYPINFCAPTIPTSATDPTPVATPAGCTAAGAVSATNKYYRLRMVTPGVNNSGSTPVFQILKPNAANTTQTPVAAHASSNYTAAGVITIVAKAQDIGLTVAGGEKLTKFLTRIEVNGGAVNPTPDNMSDSLAGEGQFTNVNRTFCAPNARPLASLEAEPPQGDAPLSVAFTVSGSDPDNDALASYTLDFGDGEKLENQSFGGQPAVTLSHTYDEPGLFAATLVVTDAAGKVSNNPAQRAIEVLRVAGPPVARLGAAPSPVVKGNPVTLDASASSDPDNDIVEYSFDPDGDGAGFTTPPGSTLSHTYQRSGNYRATVAVKDRRGDTSVASATVMVTNTPPEAAFSADPTEGLAPFTVTFDAGGSSDADAKTGDGPVRYDFDFGDGSVVEPSPVPEVSHTFTRPDTYLVRLTVYDTEGLKSNAEALLQIEVLNNPPVAQLTADQTSGFAPLTVTFYGTGSSDPDEGGNIVSYRFDFGDGSAPVTRVGGNTVQHLYASSGQYTARLMVKDQFGAESPESPAATLVITVGPVNRAPVARMAADKYSGDAPLSVAFDAARSADTDGDSIVEYTFDFGDGTAPVTQSGPVIQHTYASAGRFLASAKVKDSRGAQSSNSDILTITASTPVNNTQLLPSRSGSLSSLSLLVLGLLGLLGWQRRRWRR